MANIIKIKRGLKADVDKLTLLPGELGVTLDTQELYVGDAQGNKQLIKGAAAGIVESAEKLATARNITMSGDATGTAAFDGSKDIEIALALANSGVAAGTYTKVTVDAKGRVTAGKSLTSEDLPTITVENISGLSDEFAKYVALSTYNGDMQVIETNLTGINQTLVNKADKTELVKNIKDGSNTGALRSSGSTAASGLNSIALGLNNTASGNSSVALGGYNEAKKVSSVALGSYNEVDGNSSVALGDGNVITGRYAIAEGLYNEVTKDYAHAEGMNNQAYGEAQHVQGKWNLASEDLAHIVGNGEAGPYYGDPDENRSNAHTLDWNGNAWYQGDVYVGSTSGKNKDEGSVRLAKVTELDSYVSLANAETISGAKDFTGGLNKSGKAVATEEYVTTQINGVNETITNLSNTVADKADASSVYTKTEVDGKIAGTFRFAGEAESVDKLPTTNVKAGDVYQVGDKEYAYDGEGWIELGFNIDLSSYITKTEVSGTYATKTALSEGLATKADKNSVYTKTETDNLLSAKATTTDLNNLTTRVGNAETEIAKKANSATTLAGYGISNAYTKTEVDTALESKLTTDSVVDGGTF